MTQKKVLVVEDDRMLAEGLSHALMSHDIVTRVARDGKEALTILEEDLPGVILTDIMMPNMNGTQLLEEIAKHDEWNVIPVIVLTNADDIETVSTVLNHGAYDYLVKAETPLSDIVQRVLDKINK